MTKYQKISIVFALLSIIVFIYFVFYSEKITTTNLNEQQRGIELNNINSTKEKMLEDQYTKRIDEIFNSSQSLVLELKNNNGMVSSSTLAENIFNKTTDDLSNLSVPKKFKNFHLLISRSFYQLSSFAQDKDNLKLKNGLILFEEANLTFKKMTNKF